MVEGAGRRESEECIVGASAGGKVVPMVLVAAAGVVVGVLAMRFRPAETGDVPASGRGAVVKPAYDSNQLGESGMNRNSGERPASGPRGGGSVSVRQGPCFRYTVPDGWQVAEDGQFAVVLRAPDQRAITTLVGNVGLPNGYNPGQFVYEKLAPLGLQGLRLGQPRPAQGVFGFPQAWDFDTEYSVNGAPCRGVARCSVAPNYDFCTMVMTWAASEASQWPSYASWLPDVASQVQVTNSAAFGAQGIAQQNLQNSIALGEQARRNREYSQQQWDETTRQRDESQARNNQDFREAMGAVQQYQNPYTNQPIELPSSNQAYWVNLNTGQIVGDPNPSFDPRTASDTNWQPMKVNR